jgi:hypothetical protein
MILLVFNKNCGVCRKGFSSNNPNQKYCSWRCREVSYGAKFIKETKRICKSCNQEFVPKQHNQILCKPHCGKVILKELKRACELCKREFIPYNGRQKYCIICRKEKVLTRKYKNKIWREWFRKKTGCGPALRQCKVCKEAFFSKTRVDKFCSNKCEEQNRLIRKKANYLLNRERLCIKRRQMFIQYPEKYLLHKMRVNIRDACIRQNATKFYKSLELIGCSALDLRKYLEQKFKSGMTWSNYGLQGWEVDHIIPCDSFDLTKIEEQKKCFHYTNLQPLWVGENRRKSCKI